MAFERTYKLYIDVAQAGGPNCLLNGTAGAPRTQDVQWMESDAFALRLYFRELNGLAATTSVALGTGDEIILAAKATPASATLLFSALTWTKVTSGSETYYEALLDLDTTELNAAVTTSNLTVVVDVQVQNSDNSRRLTFRFSAVITPQVYGGESDPTPATPTYPSPSAIMVKNPSGGSYRFKDGNLQFYNQTTTKWHTFFPYGPEGSVTSEWGAGEV